MPMAFWNGNGTIDHLFTIGIASMPIDILIAEDSRIQAKMLQKRLTDAGYAVRWAENGKDALRMTLEQRPDIIISDIEMPVMSGYEFCETVKKDPATRTIPLILLSTLSQPEDIIQGLHVGADNYVTKPYDTSYLLARVTDLLSTPLGDDGDSSEVLNVNLSGKTYQVKAGTQRILNLLVSTFANAVEKNNELVRANESLSLAHDELAKSNQELATVNQTLENSNQRMSRDLEAAAKIQQSLLPTDAPKTRIAKVAWNYTPCDELAGDFLNVVQLDEKHLALFVVDVSGHGVASSLLSVTIGRVLTAQVASSSLLVEPIEGSDELKIVSPAKVAAELNARFPMEAQGNLYFTIVYGILNLETREFRFTSCGHPGVVHLPKDGKPELIETEGFAIGWLEDIEFDEHVLKLSAGDRLFLYSDGVPEAMDHDLNELGNERMLEEFSHSSSRTLDESVQSLLELVKTWSHQNGPKDDISILGLQIEA